MLSIKSIARKKQPSFKAIYPLEYQKEIFSKLRTCYFLNATQKGLYQILLWGINKNKIQNDILSTQISSVVLSDLLKKRKKDPRKKYSASTISKLIKVLKDHEMIKTNRGRDKINRYYAIHPDEWKTNEKRNEKENENEIKKTYNLFPEKQNLTKSITNKNIKIKRERINREEEIIGKKEEFDREEAIEKGDRIDCKTKTGKGEGFNSRQGFDDRQAIGTSEGFNSRQGFNDRQAIGKGERFNSRQGFDDRQAIGTSEGFNSRQGFNDRQAIGKGVGFDPEKQNRIREIDMKKDENIDREEKAERYIAFIKRKGIRIINEKAYKIKIMIEGDDWNYKPMEEEESQEIDKKYGDNKKKRTYRFRKNEESKREDEEKIREKKEKWIKQEKERKKNEKEKEIRNIIKEREKEIHFEQKLMKFKIKDPSFYRKIENRAYERYRHLNKNLVKRYLKNYMVKIIAEDEEKKEVNK